MIERNRGNPADRKQLCAPPVNHTYDGEAAYGFAAGGGT
jgi:hypothetical protein